MHEMSLINDLMAKIKRLADENKAQAVEEVTVEIGALAHISAEHFREHFEEAAVGTTAEKAKLKVIMKDDIHDPQAQDILLKNIKVATS